MALEALLNLNRNFVHKPQHDLESILYVIITICTFCQEPALPPQPKLNAALHRQPSICAWFNSKSIQDVGFLKLAHIECYDIAILPHFTPYWRDFSPFVKDLITACFPVRANLPNELRYEKVLGILKVAYDSVREPSDPTRTGQVSVALASQVTSPTKTLSPASLVPARRPSTPTPITQEGQPKRSKRNATAAATLPSSVDSGPDDDSDIYASS